MWLQLPISSFWAYSIRISTSILNEKVYSAHSTLLLHTFPYHLHLTSFTWFPYRTLLHAPLIHFTFDFRSFLFLSSCHLVLLHSPLHSLHSFPFCYLIRHSLNSLRLFAESSMNWIQVNEWDWRCRSRSRWMETARRTYVLVICSSPSPQPSLYSVLS